MVIIQGQELIQLNLVATNGKKWNVDVLQEIKPFQLKDRLRTRLKKMCMRLMPRIEKWDDYKGSLSLCGYEKLFFSLNMTKFNYLFHYLLL